MNGNPFASDIYPDGLPAQTGGVHPLHSGAISELKEIVSRAGGRSQEESATEGGGTVVLLSAPRAGFGKSHLLARLAEEMGDRAFVVAVPFDREREALWSALLWRLLETFHATKVGSLSLLDLVARRLFALVNQQMIRDRQVPCANPAEALAALEDRWAELFDFTSATQPVARWFAEHFERLLPFASTTTGNMAGLPAEAAAHWLRVLIAYAQGRNDGEAVRWESLRWSVLQPSGPALSQKGMSIVSAGLQGEAGARQRVVEFCRLSAGVRPLVLVFDDLDLFHHETASVARIAGFITEMRRLLSRAVQVLSVNEDLWTQTFQRAIPSAIEDRLTGNQITLGGIGRDEAVDLIRTRLTQCGHSPLEVSQFLHRLNLPAWFSHEAGRKISPRAVLRYACGIWEAAQRRPVSSLTAAELSRSAITAIPSVTVTAEDAGLYWARPDSFLQIPDDAIEEEAEGLNQPRPAVGPAFQSLRKALSLMLPPLEEESALTSGAVIPAPREHEPAVLRPAPPEPVESVESQLNRRFHQLRIHFLNAPWLAIDQERIFHLLQSAGRRLAIVRWLDHPLQGSPGQSAGSWIGPDAEVLFGSEPYSDRVYWSSLIDFARERSGHGFCVGRPHTAQCRLMVFSSVKSPVNLSAWMPPDEIINVRTHFLEIQSVDQPTLATLYAADEMMRESERAEAAATPAQTFTFLIPHIEFLWKQVTRSAAKAA